MAFGGIRDHIGGGFHRYSVDAFWHVPHYEKMLYDQAQLAVAYLEGFQNTGIEFFAEIAREIIAYCQRDLRHPDGGFFSAEDADSYTDEHRGRRRARARSTSGRRRRSTRCSARTRAASSATPTARGATATPAPRAIRTAS